MKVCKIVVGVSGLHKVRMHATLCLSLYRCSADQ